MKSTLGSSLLAAAILTTLAGTAYATPFPEFSLGVSTPVFSDYSVDTQGTEVWGGSGGGLDFGQHSYTLANGVKFGVFNNSNFVSYPGSSVIVDQDGAAYGNQAADNFHDVGFSDAALNGALSFAPASAGAIYFEIQGLTPGHVYAIQAFADMTHTGNSNGNGGLSGTETVTPGPGNPYNYFDDRDNAAASTLSWGQVANPLHPGKYLNSGAGSITETLLAPANGDSFLLFTPAAGTSYAIVDALQIRDITDVPEPSTYAMMIAGLAVLGFCLRRKNALVK